MSMLAERPTLDARPQLHGLLNDALVLAAEGLGLRAAGQLRSEIRALAAARTGRLVVIGEPEQRAVEAVTGLIGAPDLASTLNVLPRVHTTYRFDVSPALLLTTTAGEWEVLLDGHGTSAEYVAAARDGLPGRLLQVDVRLPVPLLSSFAVVHLPDLHAADSSVDPLLSLTPGAALVYVKTASAPLSAAEVSFLREATCRAGRSVLLLTSTDRHPTWREVAQVDDELLRGLGCEPGRVPSIIAVGEEAPITGLGRLRRWLEAGTGSGAPVIEGLDLTRNVAVAVLDGGTDDRAPAGGGDAAANLRAAEADAAQLAHGATTWLPRLAFEFTRVRAELGERSSQALVQLEQRHEQWIQNDVAGSTRELPGVLLEELRAISRSADRELICRLDAVADHFLGGRARLILPGGIQSSIAPPDVEVRLMDVSRMHVDGRTELFAGLGNFGSGRQSLGLVSSVATAASAPVALIGGVIGLGFWRLGRRSRQDSHARLQASRWLKIQVAEAGRVIRYRVDQGLNQAQLALNLAVRDYYDRAGAAARQAVELARQKVAEAEVAEQQRAQAAAVRRARAERLLDESGRLHASLALVPERAADHHGRDQGTPP